MRFACWITKVADKYSECVILIALHGNFVYVTAPQFYVYVHFLPVSVYPVFRMWQNFKFYCSSVHTLVSLPSSTCCVVDVSLISVLNVVWRRRIIVHELLY